jgi:MFS family permease
MVKDKLDFERVAPIFALVFVDILGLTVILPLLHLYAAAFGAGPLEIGLVATAFPLSQLIGVPVFGALSDRFGRRPILLISQITTCISFIMLGLANSLEMIILSRVIDGLFGANIAAAQAALSDLTTEKTRAQGLGITGAAFGLGFILGPVIAIVTLELTDNFAIPAFVAAAYSLLSILLTTFAFKETLPPHKRSKSISLGNILGPLLVARLLAHRKIGILLILMFMQQLIFFGFESLLGLFTLSRLGLLGQGNALIFITVGVILVTVQARYIGRWSHQYGERKLVYTALFLLGIGLVLTALTPEQPHPFYIERVVAARLQAQAPVSGSESIIGEISVDLPADGHNGIFGLLWLLTAIIPISIGAGLIRPALNSLMTKYTSDYGSILGVSASFVSAANAVAPLLGGLIFQQYGATAFFLLGGGLMLTLFMVSVLILKETV